MKDEIRAESFQRVAVTPGGVTALSSFFGNICFNCNPSPRGVNSSPATGSMLLLADALSWRIQRKSDAIFCSRPFSSPLIGLSSHLFPEMFYGAESLVECGLGTEGL